MNDPEDLSIRLPDGRTLAYTENGIPDGRIVLWMHGLPGSRRDWSVGNGPELLTELGLRLIAPDRPGFGRSTPHNRRTYASFANDLASLTRTLGIETGTLVGYSAGAPYALAAAQAIGDQLRADGVVLVSPIGPRSTPKFSRGLGQTDKVMITLSRCPPAARLAMRSAIHDARQDPDKFLRTLRKDFDASANDLRLLDEPATSERVLTAFVEATAQGGRGCVSDWRLWAKDWPTEARTRDQPPIHIWHGDDDPLVPLSHAQHLERLHPGARLDVWSGEGHLHDDGTWREVLSALP